MAVVIQYAVVREGEAKLVTTSKKDADLYDKMLDTAEGLSALIASSGVQLDEKQREEIGIYLAKNKDAVLDVYKGRTVTKA